MEKDSLYRPEAVAARQADNLGAVLLLRPLSFSMFVLFSASITTILLVFLFVGTYSSRITVSGQLIPSTGLIKVFAQQRGTVIKKLVKEGQAVERGQILYVLTADRSTESGTDTQSSVIEQLRQQKNALEQEVGKTEQLQKVEQETIRKKIGTLQSERDNLVRQIDGQRARYALAESALARAQTLSSKGFISQEQFQSRQSDSIDQTNRLQSLERDRIATERELDTQLNEALSAPLRGQTQLSQLTRQLSVVMQYIAERESARSIVVTAPSKGLVTAIAAQIGQTVDADKSLLNILPVGAPLEAHLYAPSRAIGFVKPGAEVKIRFQAFPYQKFGHAVGRVTIISGVPAKLSELDAGPGPIESASADDLRYQINVELDQQYVMAYGTRRPLQTGMLVEADVIQETRRLYEWVLDPLRTISGKI